MKEDCDCEVRTVHSDLGGEGPVPLRIKRESGSKETDGSGRTFAFSNRRNKME